MSPMLRLPSLWLLPPIPHDTYMLKTTLRLRPTVTDSQNLAAYSCWPEAPSPATLESNNYRRLQGGSRVHTRI